VSHVTVDVGQSPCDMFVELFKSVHGNIICNIDGSFDIAIVNGTGGMRHIHMSIHELGFLVEAPASKFTYELIIRHMLTLMDTDANDDQKRVLSKILYFIAMRSNSIKYNRRLRVRIAGYLNKSGYFQKAIDICDHPDRGVDDIHSIMWNTFQLEMRGQHVRFDWTDAPQCPPHLANSRAIKCAEWLITHGPIKRNYVPIKILTSYCQWRFLYTYYSENRIPRSDTIDYLVYITSLYVTKNYETLLERFTGIDRQMRLRNYGIHILKIRTYENLGWYDDMMNACIEYENSIVYNNATSVHRCYPGLKEIAKRNSSKIDVDDLP
jgi:hypothetical protein